MGITIYQVDAFTDRKFAGNPAAVCLLEQPGEVGWMQQLAAETGLPASAFLHPQADGYGLRWFTPTVELPLCGHGTLASAEVLFKSGRVQPSAQARFYTAAAHCSPAAKGIGTTSTSLPSQWPLPTRHHSLPPL
jgi:PhzF family phenazine biosynthesis protein